MINQFTHNQMADMVNCGVSGGFSGLIYYSDTVELYKQYKDDIWEMLDNDAEGYGQNTIEMIANFGCAKNVSSADQFENLLVWYAAEKVAYDLTQGEYYKRDRHHRRVGV